MAEMSMTGSAAFRWAPRSPFVHPGGSPMSKYFSRRSIVLGAVLSLAIAGAAFAYWTAGGSGTGSASAANAQSALTANQAGSLTAMYPGDSAQPLSGKFTNTNS